VHGAIDTRSTRRKLIAADRFTMTARHQGVKPLLSRRELERRLTGDRSFTVDRPGSGEPDLASGQKTPGGRKVSASR
jgi:hypothetical protein